jgi:hypothetical protein
VTYSKTKRRDVMLLLLSCVAEMGVEPPPECVTGDVYCGDQTEERPTWVGCCDEFDCWYEADDGWRVYCALGDCDATAVTVTETLCVTAAPRGSE